MPGKLSVDLSGAPSEAARSKLNICMSTAEVFVQEFSFGISGR
ncbi:hypothetical protein [Mycobacterium sp. IS-1590]|nr:hypothetical protein [Mycobacterium sp. IS-1590]